MVAVSLSARCLTFAGVVVELTPMVASSVGRSARLSFPVVAFARFRQYLFLSLFVCSRSLAILGDPRNHHALCEWNRVTNQTIETGGTAGACMDSAIRRHAVRAHLAAKPYV